MHYKTIVHELLKRYPEMHEELRRKRMLLSTLEVQARRLKANHEVWKERLSQKKPGSNQSQIASEALEIALKELVDFLDSTATREDGEPPSIEREIAFIRRRTPPT